MAAAVRSRSDISVPAYDRILTGHFNERRRYAVSRPLGTSDWLAIHTLAGRGRFGSGKAALRADPGDFFLIARGTPHDYGLWERGKQWEFLWAHFHPPERWREWMRWPEAAPGLLRVRVPTGRERGEVRAALQAMHAAALGSRPLGNDLAMNLLEAAILRCARMVWKEERPLDARVRRAADFLAGSITEKFSLPETARRGGLSTWRLAHLFREQLGESPGDYHERLRLERAGELLRRTTSTVAEVAHGLGYESEFYFSRRFKRAIGRSPRAFRQEVLISPPR